MAISIARYLLLAPLLLAGCGGGSGTAPALGLGLTTHVRAINLDPNSPAVSVEAGPYGSPVGTIGPLQSTPYAAESGGSEGVRFYNSTGTLATFDGNLLFSTYNTVALYPTSSGYGTFSLIDNQAIVPLTSGWIRIANGVSLIGGSIDVYLTPGAHTAPVTESQFLITPNGLPFGQGTIYEVRTPGTYTVTVVSALDTADLLLNQEVIVNGGQAITLYVANQVASVITVDNG